jgi:hypothetical protein
VSYEGFRAAALSWLFLGGLVALNHLIQSNQLGKPDEEPG